MKDENLIHVKFEYDEALQSKREILSLEISLLKIANAIKKYRSLRLEELKLRLNLYTKIKEIIANMRKLQTTLPKLKIPEILNKPHEKQGELKIKKIGEESDIESQLQEIQNKLNALQE